MNTFAGYLIAMKSIKITILVLFLIFTHFGWCGKIVYPWRATTAIVKAGESFDIWFNADAGQKVSKVLLQSPYYSGTTKHRVQKGTWEYDATSANTYNTKITVNVPRSTPANRYDIVLQTNTGEVISLAGVKVIREYKSNYYILHFSDAHAFQKGTETVLHRLSAIVDIANILDAELVFNTGDNMYRPTVERMDQFFIGNNVLGTKGLNQLNAATFTVAGNHDFDFDNLPEKGYYKEKADWWNQWWGLQYYNFSYGDARFLAFNNGWDGFKPVLQYNAMAEWLQKVGKGNLRVGLAHIRNKEMATFDSIAHPGLVLIGHNHHIANQNPSPLYGRPVQYIVNSVREHMEFNLFRVDVEKGTYSPVGNSTAQVVYVENQDEGNVPGLYQPKLTLTYLNSNDGTSKTNTATIANRFNFPIEQAKVRFVMPLHKKYSVSNGTIEQTFKGDNVQVVDVRVNMEPTSTTNISIFEM